MVGAQMVWLGVVRTRFADRVQPGEAEIDAEMARLAGADIQRSREEVRNELTNRQGERLAEGLLQEMRRDALIEVR